MRFQHLLFTTVLLAAFAGAPVRADAGTELDERLARLVERLEAEREAAHVPGLALAVVKDDAVVLAHGFGLADREKETPVTPETLFAVGSTTKAFTTALIATLVAEGKLAWDDPIAEHLPYFTLAVDSDDEDAALTLRDLCSHRTGFTRMSLLWIGGDVPRETILRTAAGAEPWSGFREGFHYNNVMYLAAGEAAARVAGASWDELVATRLFGPLGMRDTSTSVARALEDPRLAAGYAWDDEKRTFERKPMRVLDAIAPAGAINSNVLDMAQWVRLQLGRGALGDRRVVDADRLTETWERQVTVGGDVGYGLGWFLRTWNGRRVIEHGGNIDGFSAQVAFLPDDGLGYVLLANTSFTPLQIGSIGIVCEELLGEPAEGAADGAGHDELVGAYTADFGPFRDAVFAVTSKDGRLAVDVPGQTNYVLKEPDADGKRFFALTDEIAVSFERDGEGRVIGMKMYQGGFAFELPRQGVEVEPDPVPSGAHRCVGRYRDEKIGVLEVLLKDNNRLAVDVPGQMVYELLPPDADGEWVFRIRDTISVRFNEDADGRVVSLTNTQDGRTRELPRVADEEGTTPLPTLAEVLALRDVERRGAVLESLCGLRATGTVRFASAGLDGRFTTLIGGHDRYRNDIELGPFGSIRTAAAGGKAWSLTSFKGFEELAGTRLAQVREGNPLAAEGDWRRTFSSIAVERTDELDGRAVIVLELRNGEAPPVTYFVDAGNGDLLRAESTIVEGPARVPVTTTLSDFRDVEGVRMAFRATSENEASGRTVLQIEAWETGLELADEDLVLEAPARRPEPASHRR